MKFRIHDRLWPSVSKDREREWQHGLMDLNAEVDGEPPTITLDLREDGGIDFAVDPPGAMGDGVLAVPGPRITPSYRDYRDIIVRLSTAGAGAYGMRDYETLDYAKKLVHDDAGDVIRRAFRDADLPVDIRLARRIFTLAFLVGSDLPEGLIRSHRRHGPPGE